MCCCGDHIYACCCPVCFVSSKRGCCGKQCWIAYCLGLLFYLPAVCYACAFVGEPDLGDRVPVPIVIQTVVAQPTAAPNPIILQQHHVYTPSSQPMQNANNAMQYGWDQSIHPNNLGQNMERMNIVSSQPDGFQNDVDEFRNTANELDAKISNSADLYSPN